MCAVEKADRPGRFTWTTSGPAATMATKSGGLVTSMVAVAHLPPRGYAELELKGKQQQARGIERMPARSTKIDQALKQRKALTTRAQDRMTAKWHWPGCGSVASSEAVGHR